MTKNKKSKWIVDERQEIQNLKNIRIAWYVVMAVLTASVWIQTIVMGRDWVYSVPELLALIAGGATQLILDIKGGILYTKENSNRRRVWIMYVASCLLGGGIVAVVNYIRYEGAWYIYLVFGGATSAFMFVSILAFDAACTAMTKRKIVKQEARLQEQEREIEE